MSGNETVGRTLVTYSCLFMVLGCIVLFIADRLGFGGERGKSIGRALAESVPPLIAREVRCRNRLGHLSAASKPWAGAGGHNVGYG